MENQKQYLKFKPQFKKNAIMKIVTNAVMFLTLLLLFFLPCFRIQPEGAEIGELIGIDLGKNFSLYDEVMLVFSSFSLNGEEAFAFAYGLIFQIFAVVCFAGGLIATAVDLIKSTMYCINPENYAILEYDKIKSKMEKQKGFRQFSPQSFFFLAVIYEVSFIFFSKMVSTGSTSTSTSVDYFISMNAVAWGFWIVLIFLIADIVFAVLLALNRNRLQVEILKEDYEKKDANVEQPEN